MPQLGLPRAPKLPCDRLNRSIVDEDRQVVHGFDSQRQAAVTASLGSLVGCLQLANMPCCLSRALPESYCKGLNTRSRRLARPVTQ